MAQLNYLSQAMSHRSLCGKIEKLITHFHRGNVHMNETECVVGEAGAVPHRMDESGEKLMSLGERISLSSFSPGNLTVVVIVNSYLAQGNTVTKVGHHFKKS